MTKRSPNPNPWVSPGTVVTDTVHRRPGPAHIVLAASVVVGAFPGRRCTRDLGSSRIHIRFFDHLIDTEIPLFVKKFLHLVNLHFVCLSVRTYEAAAYLHYAPSVPAITGKAVFHRQSESNSTFKVQDASAARGIKVSSSTCICDRNGHALLLPYSGKNLDPSLLR
ncbi:hypothetical protein BJX65DRAFT_280628 [Aspergillus insuetus]